MKLEIKFTADVDFLDELHRRPEDLAPGTPLARAIEKAVAMAVKDALDSAHENGFNHTMDKQIYILVDGEIGVSMLEQNHARVR